MLDAMPAELWDQWQLYRALHPFGSDREDLRAMFVGCMARAAMASGVPFDVKEVFPNLFPPEPVVQRTREAEQREAQQFAISLGGTIQSVE